MRSLLGSWRVLRALAHVVHGLAVLALRFPFLDARGRRLRVQWWSRRMLEVLGVALHSRGRPRGGAKLLVANHVSWLDILAIDAVDPARFVSKSEVRHWPVIGWLVTASGTLYIERGRSRDALRVVHRMADSLRAGDTVAIFPEGTTGEGPQPLPFHANLLQAAIATDTPVQPVVLRYSDATLAFSRDAAYVGDTHLLQSVWAIVRARELTAHVEFLPPQGSAHAERRALAEHLRETIAQRLRT